jgi:hypothetical protein
MRKSWQLSRRRMLRGGGALMALPLLDVMGPTTARAATIRPPVRMGFLFFPNGVRVDAWMPKGNGGKLELSKTLKPLAPVKNDILVFSGLRHQNARGGDGHYAKTANFLTGTKVVKTIGKDLNSGGISIDQLAAQQIGQYTPLPSYELGIEAAKHFVDKNVNYTYLYAGYISWKTATMPIPKEIVPQLAFDRLFRKRGRRKPASDQPSRDKDLFAPLQTQAEETSDDQSVLDLVREDAKNLRGKVSASDQRKLDEYLEAVRSVERQIERANKPDERKWKPKSLPKNLKRPGPGIPDYQAHVGIMLDLMVLAFWTDTTRVSSFMFSSAVSGRNVSFIDGVSGGWHDISHHQNKAEKLDAYQRINAWHYGQMSKMFERMKKIDEGDGTLLDNSMILTGSGFADGNKHDPGNLPIVLAGRGGGSIKTGRFLKYKKPVPLCNLYQAMLARAGAKVKKFGDASGMLDLR